MRYLLENINHIKEINDYLKIKIESFGDEIIEFVELYNNNDKIKEIIKNIDINNEEIIEIKNNIEKIEIKNNIEKINNKILLVNVSFIEYKNYGFNNVVHKININKYITKLNLININKLILNLDNLLQFIFLDTLYINCNIIKIKYNKNISITTIYIYYNDTKIYNKYILHSLYKFPNVKNIITNINSKYFENKKNYDYILKKLNNMCIYKNIKLIIDKNESVYNL